MSAFDQTIRSFLIEAGASVPTPGGGSVSALVAALGASMGSMAACYTRGDKFREVEGAMQEAARRMAEVCADCEMLLEADMLAFEDYLSALKLPKDTAEQQRLRSAAMAEAAVRAAEVPLRLMRVCRDALAGLQSLAADANKQVISDLGIGLLLLEAAAQSARLTADINLAGLADAGKKQALEAEARDIMREMTAMKEAALAVVRRRIGV